VLSGLLPLPGGRGSVLSMPGWLPGSVLSIPG
jgi:hypothetical protein